MKTRPTPFDEKNATAFSRTELLAVLAILAVVVIAQLPLLGSSQSGSQAAVCTENMRRMIQAWTMYADDNHGLLTPNNGNLTAADGRQSWVSGWLDFTSNLDNINTAYLVDSEQTGRYGLLGPYLRRDATVFRCPADRSRVNIFGSQFNRVRSYSMNNWMGGESYNQESGYKVYRKLDDITRPEPSSAMVMLEEREDSLNDGVFNVAIVSLGIWVDFPASRHDGGMNLSFSDGHVGYRYWQNPLYVSPEQGLDSNPNLKFIRSIATAPQ